ncbi:MAG: hypothetical protein HZY75_01330 [Nocardioidaceae bacterium]|nr:MAG: hypothetical protein HZY75_01330 [Nocardioidaceae bacterium]
MEQPTYAGTDTGTITAVAPVQPAAEIVDWHNHGFRLWVGAVAVGLLLCLSGWTSWDVPGVIPELGAVTITTAYAYALAVRTGGAPITSMILAAGLGLLALGSFFEQGILLSGVAIGTAALAAILGTMLTQPARRVRDAVRELLVGVCVAVVGAFAVEAYRAPIAVDRAGFVALAVALGGTLLLVYRLGAGLHGIGRRGTVVVLLGILLLFVALGYSEAVHQWGSGDLRGNIDDFVSGVRDLFGAVPRPTEFLLGFPALMWGASIRARRRQGWWMCAFGSAGLTVVATSLLHPIPLTESALVLGYSLVLGIVAGYLMIRLDAYLTGPRGRRARQAEEELAHRPEPGRTRPLL